MEFHRARTARMAGAAAPAMPKHRQARDEPGGPFESDRKVALGRPPTASKALAVAQATVGGLLVAPEARFQRDADRPAQGHETS